MTDGLTDEQRAAVETLDADVCVVAGAGSGKTRVLVERFLRLTLGERTGDGRQVTLEDGLSSVACRPSAAVDEILAITFTRKAALEMKARIAHALAARGRVEEQRRLEVGFISTIHTFCERVLRENPFEAGLDPEFGVLDEPEAALLLNDAFEQVLEAAFARPDDPVADLAHACYDRRTSNGDDGVRLLRDQLITHLRVLSSRGWSPSDVAAWAQEPSARRLERSLEALAEALNPVITAFRDGAAVLAGLSLVNGAMEENRLQLVAACEALCPWERGRPARMVSNMRASRGPAPAAVRRPTPWVLPAKTRLPRPRSQDSPPDESTGLHLSDDEAATTTALCEIETQIALLRQLRGSLKATKQTQAMDPEAYATAREQFDALKTAWEDIEPWAKSWTPVQEQRSQQLAGAGLELLARLWARYEGLKRERAALDFSDLQRLTRDLLRDHPAVRARLRRRLKYLMVDEFQDTDHLQAEILDLLRGEGNLFFVGDARQSIYRFRNADVRLFQERERAIAAAQAGDMPRARRVSLATNFRSRPEILHFINTLFSRLWSGETSPPSAQGGGREGGSGCEHTPSTRLHHEPLTPGRAFAEKVIPSVEWLAVEVEGGIDGVRRAEAVLIARRVRELVDGGARITRCDHPRHGEVVRPGDVVLLLRTTAVAALYEQSLAAAGLATFVVGGRHYYARREIRDVVNLLKTLGRPLDDLAVASTLRSPFVGISLDTLTLLSLQAEALPREERCLSAAIASALESQPIAADDSARLRAFIALIDRLRAEEDRYGVGQILETALAETDVTPQVLRRPGGRRALANLRKLTSMAHAHAAGGVLAFVERIEALTKISEREGDAPTHAETDDVVRLMTIHQAKGLEFPVVVLPDLGRGAPPADLPLLALDPDRRLAACRLTGDTGYDPLLHHARAHADREAEREESLRVLYVALTRAEEHLILAGPQTARAGTWAQLIGEHASF
jgi:ATP-dependent exoDNAse (exonuclease V) beta subunit